MRVRFTKRGDGRHRLTVVRDDGGVSQGQMVPGFGPHAIPHDLLHALVEDTLGLERGVYGMVNTGMDLAALLAPEQKSMNKGEAELILSEVVTTLLQAEAAHAGVTEDDFRDRLRDQCAEHGLALPVLSDDTLGRLRSRRDEHQRRWRELGEGATLEVEVQVRRAPDRRR